jgi:hypothetical protein
MDSSKRSRNEDDDDHCNDVVEQNDIVVEQNNIVVEQNNIVVEQNDIVVEQNDLQKNLVKSDVGKKYTQWICIPGVNTSKLKGWDLDIYKCANTFTKPFTIQDMYQFEKTLFKLYPKNNNIQPNIRKHVSYLTKKGYLNRIENFKTKETKETNEISTNVDVDPNDVDVIDHQKQIENSNNKKQKNNPIESDHNDVESGNNIATEPITVSSSSNIIESLPFKVKTEVNGKNNKEEIEEIEEDYEEDTNNFFGVSFSNNQFWEKVPTFTEDII